MIAALRVLGIDPGPVPGMVRLDFEDGRLVDVQVLQCTLGLALDAFRAMTRQDALVDRRQLLQVERFVVGNRSARSSTPGAGAATRDLVGRLQQDAAGRIRYLERSASEVKPWATDARLEAVRFSGQSLLDLTKGMRHAKDAARHAIYAASNAGGIPDPLSKGARA